MDIDRTARADSLRLRREALQPADVGLPRGQRRRTRGLRREEVAALSHMSTDYYARLERARGPQPSEQMIGSIAQGLHLTLPERDHLHRLAGHTPPTSASGTTQHMAPGMLRILDRLDDTPAEIVTELGETLRQTRMGVALVGDLTRYTGRARSLGEAAVRRGPDSRAADLVDALLRESDEFRALWELHEVGLRPAAGKSFLHPDVGRLDLDCQTLLDPDQSHLLLVYTASPGSESYQKLELLSVIAAA